MVRPSFHEFAMAMDRVERRLRQVTSALEDAGIPYAVVGGNAVAAWVARVAPAGTRTTKDVDVLIRRVDVDRVTVALESVGFQRQNLRDLVIFIDPDEPDKRAGVHLVWAGERIRPSYEVTSPAVEEAVRDARGFRVLDLPALVRMKLTSFRDIDRVHIADLLSVGLINDDVRASLPPSLVPRLHDIERSLDED